MEEMYEMGNEMKLQEMERKLHHIQYLINEFCSEYEESKVRYEENIKAESDLTLKSFYRGCSISNDISLIKFKSIQEVLKDEHC